MENKTLDTMTKSELSDYMNEKEAELRQEMETKKVALTKDIKFGQDILQLRLDKKRNEGALEIAEDNIRIINSMLREARNRYFNVTI